MSKLISGKEAKLAWANGEKIQWRHNETCAWVDLLENRSLSCFNDRAEWRVKPRTIKINGIEVPAPFKPEYGDDVYYLDGKYECGYNNIENCRVKTVGDYSLGFWRTEEEIKQVVAALRQVFKGEQA